MSSGSKDEDEILDSEKTQHKRKQRHNFEERALGKL